MLNAKRARGFRRASAADDVRLHTIENPEQVALCLRIDAIHLHGCDDVVEHGNEFLLGTVHALVSSEHAHALVVLRPTGAGVGQVDHQFNQFGESES